MTIEAMGFLGFILFAGLGIWLFASNWLRELKTSEKLESALCEMEYEVASLECTNEKLKEELAKAQTVISFLKLELKEKEDKKK